MVPANMPVQLFLFVRTLVVPRVMLVSAPVPVAHDDGRRYMRRLGFWRSGDACSPRCAEPARSEGVAPA